MNPVEFANDNPGCLQILRDLFEESLSGKKSVKSRGFRAQRADHRDLIDELVKARLVLYETRDSTYQFSLWALWVLRDQEGREYIEAARKLYPILRQSYVDDSERYISIGELGSKTSLDPETVRVSLGFMDQLSILGSSNFYHVETPDGNLQPSEGILDATNFDELIHYRMTQWWRPLPKRPPFWRRLFVGRKPTFADSLFGEIHDSQGQDFWPKFRKFSLVLGAIGTTIGILAKLGFF